MTPDDPLPIGKTSDSPTIDPLAVREALEAKGVSWSCCQSGESEDDLIVGVSVTRLPSLDRSTIPETITNKGYDVITVICPWCGLVRLYAADVIGL